MGVVVMVEGRAMLTGREVAERIGRDDSRVRQLCIAGRFPGAVKVSNRWFIPEAAVEEYERHPDERRKRVVQEGEAG